MSSIKKDLAKNTIWNSVERLSNMRLQILCTFILARYLTPSVFLHSTILMFGVNRGFL